MGGNLKTQPIGEHVGNAVNWREKAIEQILKPLYRLYPRPPEDVRKPNLILKRGDLRTSIIDGLIRGMDKEVVDLPEEESLYWGLRANRDIIKMMHRYYPESKRDAVANRAYNYHMRTLRGRAEELIKKLEKFGARKACRARLWATEPVFRTPRPVKIGDKAYEVCPHPVGPGDTPASVAKKYRISEELLKAANKKGIRDDEICSSSLDIPLPPTHQEIVTLPTKPQKAESK